MKKTVLLSVFICTFLWVYSQEDTTNRHPKHDKDSIIIDENASLLNPAELLIFEGNYKDISPAEVAVDFTFSRFIASSSRGASSKPPRKMHAHDGGFAFGFNTMANKDLTNLGNIENAVLKYSSYELALQLSSFTVPISRKAGFLFFSGVGLRFVQYNADLNTAFREVNHITRQVEANEPINYKVSKLNSWYVTIPLMFEWQTKIPRKTFYIQAGVEAGIRFSTVSKVKYFIDGHKYKHKLDRGLNMNPLTLDAKVGSGFSHVGLYARYGLLNLFRVNRGPECVPLALGIVIEL